MIKMMPSDIVTQVQVLYPFCEGLCTVRTGAYQTLNHGTKENGQNIHDKQSSTNYGRRGLVGLLRHFLVLLLHLIRPPQPSLTQPQSKLLHSRGVHLHTSAGRSLHTFLVSLVASQNTVPPIVFPCLEQLCEVAVHVPLHFIDLCLPSRHRTAQSVLEDTSAVSAVAKTRTSR